MICRFSLLMWFEYIDYKKSKPGTYSCAPKIIEKHSNVYAKANARKSKQKIKGNQ